MTELCPKCGEKPAAHMPSCPICGYQIGYPNVRAAAMPLEKDALEGRLRKARQSADTRGCRAELESLGQAVAGSVAVMARNISALASFVLSDHSLYSTFHEQVRSNMRIPEDNEQDKVRNQIESAFFPHYYDKINYACLSLDGRGIEWFGGYFITFKQRMIEIRASVFEENVFDFANKHALPMAKPPPPGFRSTWELRGDLAMAKLGPKVRSSLTPAEFPDLVLHQPTTGEARCDYIEVHIYGPISGRAIEGVLAPVAKTAPDAAIWEGVKARLVAMGATIREV